MNHTMSNNATMLGPKEEDDNDEPEEEEPEPDEEELDEDDEEPDAKDDDLDDEEPDEDEDIDDDDVEIDEDDEEGSSSQRVPMSGLVATEVRHSLKENTMGLLNPNPQTEDQVLKAKEASVKAEREAQESRAEAQREIDFKNMPLPLYKQKYFGQESQQASDIRHKAEAQKQVAATESELARRARLEQRLPQVHNCRICSRIPYAPKRTAQGFPSVMEMGVAHIECGACRVRVSDIPRSEDGATCIPTMNRVITTWNKLHSK